MAADDYEIDACLKIFSIYSGGSVHHFLILYFFSRDIINAHFVFCNRFPAYLNNRNIGYRVRKNRELVFPTFNFIDADSGYVKDEIGISDIRNEYMVYTSSVEYS